jgi:hypothetical protein
VSIDERRRGIPASWPEDRCGLVAPDVRHDPARASRRRAGTGVMADDG